LPNAFVYAEEGAKIKNNTYPLLCRYVEGETVFCIPEVDGVSVDRGDQFEPYKGVQSRYWTYAYKTDSFTTEQESFLPLERELLSVQVQKTKYDRYSYTFSRRNPLNQTETVGEPLQGQDIEEKDFKLGAIRNAYKDLIDPDDSFSLNTFLSCTGLSFTRTFVNVFFVGYEFLNELVWELIIGGSINAAELAGDIDNLFIFRLFDLLYKYDGPWYSRDEEPPCNPPLPLDAKRLTYEEYKEDYYNPYCGQPNLQFHVYSNLDRSYFFMTSILEKRSFGKMVFNLLRFFPETLRVATRMVLDLQSGRFFRRLALLPFGCGQTYNNKTGDCTSINDPNGALKPPCPIGFPSADCTCRVEDPLLDFDTTCACIWLPSARLDADLRQTTSVAVSHWCGVNMLEWPLIYLSRINDAFKLIIDTLQVGAKQFPVKPDLCKVDVNDRYTAGGKQYDLLEESLIDRVFGGVVTRNFDQNIVESCDITAEHDFACSLASILDRIVKFILNIIRKIWRNSVSVMSLKPDAVDVDMTSEICNIEKLQAALASTVVEMAPGFSQQALLTKRGITSLIYSFLDIIGAVFSEVHVGLLFVRAFLSGDASILEGGAEGNEEGRAMISGADLSTIFYGAMTKFVVVITTFFKQLFESLAKIGGRALFLQIRDIVDFLEQLITGGIIPIIAQVLYLGIRVLGLIFTPHLVTGSDIGQIITQTLDLIGQVITMLLSQAMRVLGIILRMMGTFGKLIGSLLGLVCKIQGTLSDITFGAWKKMDCSALPSFRRRALAEETEPEITRMVYDEMNWDGPSFCDHFITSYRDWKFGDLRPIEQLRFQECVEWRLLGEEFRNRTGLTSLPHDLFYNWKQPPMLFAKGLQAGFLYARWWLQDGTSVSALKQSMEESGLPAMDILQGVHLVKRVLSDTVTRQNAHDMMMNVFREHDATFEDPNSNSSTRKAYEVYDAVSTSVFGIYDIVVSKEFQHNLKSLKDFSIPEHGFTLGPPALPSAELVFSTRALQLVDDVNKLPQTFGRVYSDLECQQTDDNLFCFECAILDNHIQSSFETIKRTAQFYTDSFEDDFLTPFNDSWNAASSYNRKYQKAYKSAQSGEETYGSPDRASDWDDWVAYAEGLVVHQNRTFSELTDALNYWFQGNYTGEIPTNATLLLPGSFQEALELPFQADCTTADFLWKKQLRSPFYGLLPYIGMLVAFEVFQFVVFDFSVLLKLTVYTVMGILGLLFYLIVVYDYNPFCVPQVPTYLVADFVAWLEDVFFITCSCGWFPFLAKDCQQQT
jgi:hypothetical protein